MSFARDLSAQGKLFAVYHSFRVFIARTQTLERMSKDFSPAAEISSRRMTKTDFPGRYPYRDFGLKYWEATHTWVTEYLEVSPVCRPCSRRPKQQSSHTKRLLSNHLLPSVSS